MNCLFTRSLLFYCFLLLCSCDVNTNIDADGFRNKPNFTKETKADIPQRLEELSNELKSRAFLLPRRTVQYAGFLSKIREQKFFKTFFQNRLNRENQQYKIVELFTDCQIIYFAALLCRKGYYIYALRKLLI